MEELVRIAKVAGKVLMSACCCLEAASQSVRADQIGDSDMGAWTEARNRELTAVSLFEYLWKPAA